MTKRYLKILAVLTVLCLALCGIAACSKGSAAGVGAVVLPSVDAEGITVDERTYGVVVRWESIEDADNYTFTCNGVTTETRIPAVNVMLMDGFTRPTNGVFKISIQATGAGFYDSIPTEITYRAKGVKLNSPDIRSLNDGVLEWAPVSGASAYRVNVNGTAVSNNADGKYHGTAIDIRAYAEGEELEVSVAAVGDGSLYFHEGDPMKVGVNKARTKLVMFPVREYTVSGGVLSWDAVSFAKAYRIVDITGTIVKTLPAPEGKKVSFDMNGRTLVAGVYPVSGNTRIADAEIEPVDIDYLDGDGSVSDPFVIKTPFDLRAIDYYETKYAEKLRAAELAGTAEPDRYVYSIANDIDYGTVAALDSDSNINTISQPLYGAVRGNGHTLSGMRVVYDGGYWALFDYITNKGSVTNLKFDAPEISNELQSSVRPINASIATVAYTNYGIISNIEVTDAHYVASGGEVSGICSHNYGTVSGCTVSGEFVQKDTEFYSQACYEMAGVVVENCGVVENCSVPRLDIRGTKSFYEIWQWDEEQQKNVFIGLGSFNNVRTAAAIVSVNRASGTVRNNSYGVLNLIRMVDDYGQNGGGHEFGGLVAYNAGIVVRGSASNIGKMTWSNNDAVGGTISTEQGSSVGRDLRGKAIGKNEGTYSN